MLCIVAAEGLEVSAVHERPADSSPEVCESVGQSKVDAVASPQVGESHEVEPANQVEVPEVVLHPESDSLLEVSAPDVEVTECVQVCILADSLFADMDLQGTHVWPVRGAGIEVFSMLLEIGSINPCLYSKVVLALGSNDVANYANLDVVKDMFSDFCDAIFDRNKDVTIVLCSVLPRLRDDQATKDKVVKLNKYFRVLAKRDQVRYIRTNVGFIRNRSIRRDLFADGLHLSQAGLDLVRKNLCRELAVHTGTEVSGSSH